MKPLRFCAVLAACGAAFAALEAKASKGSFSGDADVLLVLGCRVLGDEAEPMLKMRAEAAADFLLAHPNTLCIPCGGIVHADQTKSEAQAIKEILLSRGVEDTRILLEDRSKTTLENFLNAKKIIASLPLNAPKVAFLSSEFHLLRAAQIAKLADLPCEAVPAPSPQTEKAKNYLREAAVFPLLLTELHKRKGK